MKTRLILISWVLFICLATAPAFGAKGGVPNGKPFIVIQDQIVEVEGAISDLSDQIADLVERADTMEGQIAANQVGIASLTTANADLQAQIDANATDIDSLQATVDALEADNIALQDQIDANGDADGALQALIDANTALITANQLELAGLSTLQGQIDNNSTLIAMLQSDIDGINASLALKQDILDGTCPTGEALFGVAPEGTIMCTPAGGASPGQLQNLTVVTTGYIYWPPALFTGYATCPSGWTLSGGGLYTVHQFDFGTNITVSAPAGNSWQVSLTNWRAYNRPFYIYAQCMRIAP
jgi:peptidoglycan hydrolase CwlO-like protein